MATAANQTPEIDTFLRTALGTVVEAASLRGAGVLLLNREESSLSQLSYQGDTACPVARLGRQPIPFEADTVLEGHLEGHLRPYLDAEQGVGATAWLPLQTKGRFLGVLVAGAGGKALAPAMMDLLEALAGQVAIGLDNALLYREAERRAAQLAETNQALREALRGKDEFLANVTHELRRPLAPARLVVETLLEAPPGKLSRQRQDRLLRNALNNLDSLNTLVSELLDTVRLERRTQPFADDVFDLCTTTRRSLATMRPLAEARHIQIQAILPPVAVRVRGDPQALARVIANLLSNAIKFNKEGGSILLQLERTSEGRALLSVTDTGIGIPSHARPHIFERFYQADSSSTRTHEGLGLGLYIAKETVERHAGQIRFDTEEGVGSTFTVTLPLA